MRARRLGVAVVLVAMFPVYHTMYNTSANASEAAAPLRGIDPGPNPVVITPPDEAPADPDSHQGPGGAANDGDEPIAMLQEREDLDENDDGALDDTPDWAIGKGEQPGGVQNMKGGWKMRIFTADQQK